MDEEQPHEDIIETSGTGHADIIRDVGGVLLFDDEVPYENGDMPALLLDINIGVAQLFFSIDRPGKVLLLLATDKNDLSTIYGLIISMSIFAGTEGYGREIDETENMMVVVPVENCSWIKTSPGNDFLGQNVTLRWTNGKLFAMAAGMRW